MATKKRKSGSKKKPKATAKSGADKKAKSEGPSGRGDSKAPLKREAEVQSASAKGAEALTQGTPSQAAEAENSGDAGVAKEKKPERLSRPGVRYRTEAPAIADTLAEQAKKGSYLHARELRQMAMLDDAGKKRSGRRSSGVVKVLLQRLDEMAKAQT